MWVAPQLFASILIFSSSLAVAQALPALKFDPTIPGFSGGSGEPSAWTADNAYPGATLLIYGFRPFSGDFAGRFRQTLLRDVVKDMQQSRLAAPPFIEAAQVPGADAALYAKFIEDYFGVPRYHLLVAILAKGAVAIIDYSAQGEDSYQRHVNGVIEMLKTMSVGAEQPRKPLTAQQTAAARSLAGLYLGSALQFVPSPVLGASPGSGSWMSGTRFYLLSLDGRVYRGYGLPKAPGGDISRFDFEKANLEDRYNSGVFAVEGARVVLRFGGGLAPEEQSSRLPHADEPLEINGTSYKRQSLK